jgi:hypothetical protein
MVLREYLQKYLPLKTLNPSNSFSPPPYSQPLPPYVQWRDKFQADLLPPEVAEFWPENVQLFLSSPKADSLFIPYWTVLGLPRCHIRIWIWHGLVTFTNNGITRIVRTHSPASLQKQVGNLFQAHEEIIDCQLKEIWEDSIEKHGRASFHFYILRLISCQKRKTLSNEAWVGRGMRINSGDEAATRIRLPCWNQGHRSLGPIYKIC